MVKNFLWLVSRDSSLSLAHFRIQLEQACDVTSHVTTINLWSVFGYTCDKNNVALVQKRFYLTGGLYWV